MNRVPSIRTGRRRARLARVAPALLLSFGLSAGADGRGPTPPGGDAGRSAGLDDVIAADLGAVLAWSFEPRVTTVQIPRGGENRVIRSLVSRLLERGFGVQRVATDQGPNLLVHTRVLDRALEGTRVTARLAVGSVAVRRDYLLDVDGRVRTAGPLRVYGATDLIPPGSLSDDLLRVDDPSHLDIEYVAGRRSTTDETR